MQESKIWHKNKNMAVRQINDETVLMPIYRSSKETSCIYTLNQPASRAWELINGKKTLGKIKNELLKEFDSSPKEIEKELSSLIGDLKKIKAIK